MKKLAALIFSILAWSAPLAALAQGAPPNCPDTGGNHLNYTSATKSWACGTSTSGITIDSSTITGGTSTEVLFNNAGTVGDTSKLLIPATAGQGPSVVAGTATTNVPAFTITRTNNNAAVNRGVEFAFTDTASATGAPLFQVLCGASATNVCFGVLKSGMLQIAGPTGTTGNIGGGTFNNEMYFFPNTSGANPTIFFDGNGFKMVQRAAGVYAWTSSTTSAAAATVDTGLSRVGAGIVGVGTGAAGSIAGGLQMASIGFNSGKIAVSATAPTIASGGCTSPTVTNTNGTAYFTIDVGTSCSGNQAIVFTLPAATTGWNCYARNVTNGATSAPAQTGAISTTSVTITNFVRTTGVEGAWTDGDDITVSCLGG